MAVRQNGTAVTVDVVSVNDYQNEDIFLLMKQIENPDNPRHDISLPDMTSSHASFRM